MNRESWMDDVLAGLREEHLERQVTPLPRSGGTFVQNGRAWLNFSSNDYLDLAHHPAVIDAAVAALQDAGAGATASRLVTGTLAIHEELERQLAAFKGYPAALSFSSGYLTNAGTIPALVGRDDVVFADRLSHASLLDAITLSRAALRRFRHNDAAHLDELLKRRGNRGRKLVVTESVFSMDGDLAPLPEIAAVAARHGAMLLVDEAHATGVFGPGGAGLVREHRLEESVNVSMGTLSKALGGSGGFVACSRRLRNLLINRARAFIYTTAPPPSVPGAALGALSVLAKNPGLGSKLLRRAAGLRAALDRAGLDTMGSRSQIIPVRIGDSERALSLAARLRRHGILAVAIRPPTVPAGTARLRLSVTLAHTDRLLEQAAETILRAARAESLL